MTNAIIKTAAVALVGAMTLGAGMMAAPAPAEASEHCKGVYINVANPNGATVKVIDIDYWDESAGRWRSEPVKNRVLRKGESWSWRKRLEKVGAENTKLRVEYRVYIGKTFNKWSKKKAKVTNTRKCTRNMSWNVNI